MCSIGGSPDGRIRSSSRSSRRDSVLFMDRVLRSPVPAAFTFWLIAP
jgi:hypothetical protein